MKTNRITRLFMLKKYCFFLAMAGTMVSYLAYLTEHIFMSRMGVITVLLLGFTGCIFSALKYQEINRQTAIQMFWIYFVFTALWNLAALSEYSSKTYPLVIVLGLITLNISTLFWFFVSVREKDIIKYIANWGKRNQYLLLLMVLFVALSVETINDWLRVDSYSYYAYISAAKSWDFTFETFRLLQYCAHNTFGYSLFSLIGEYLLPGNGYGVRIIQIAMACLTIATFSNIIKKLKIDAEKGIENALITAIFAFSPLYMGILYEINLDFPTMCFFIWFLYSYVNKKQIFELASIFLLIFSKETGILLLFGFALGWFISMLWSNWRERNFAFIKDKYIWYQVLHYFIPALFFVIVFFLSDRWNQDEMSIQISESGDTLFKFGLNIDNIVIKLKEFFIINFNWIVVLAFLICVLRILLKKTKRIDYLQKQFSFMAIPLMGSATVFFLFNIVYIAHCPARYVLPGHVILYVFFAYTALIILKMKTRIVLYCFVVTAFLIQNFITIDPLTLYAFKNIDIGKGKIITTRTFVTDENGKITTDDEIRSNNEMDNSASYNRQYSYFGDLFEKFLRKIEYDDSTLIAIAPTYGEYVTKLSLFGKWDPNALYFYNPATGHVVLDETQSVLNIQVITEDTEMNFYDYERIYLVYFPYREQYYHADSLLEKYIIRDSFDVEYRLWLLHAYQLK